MLKSVQLISFKRSSDNASLRTFLDFNSLKSPLLFLGFWVTETGYWPVPFSLDEAFQLGRLLISLFLMPGSWKKSYEKEKKTSNGLDKFCPNHFSRFELWKNVYYENSDWLQIETGVDLRLNSKQSVAHVYFKRLIMSTSYLCDKLWCGITEDF